MAKMIREWWSAYCVECVLYAVLLSVWIIAEVGRVKGWWCRS
jgi:hypothetical protein